MKTPLAGSHKLIFAERDHEQIVLRIPAPQRAGRNNQPRVIDLRIVFDSGIDEDFEDDIDTRTLW
jgi:hypothetical protein